jgi:nucleotide-binding universal stress UspA family protein
VLWTAARFPLPPNCGIHIIAVYPAQTWATFVVASDTDPSDLALSHKVVRVQSVEDEKLRAEAWVESLAREARDALPAGASACPITTETRQGIPSDALIHAAGNYKAALMVVGAPNRHERTPLDLFRTDSVSERVLRNAPCSVLFFRNPVRSESTRDENRE